MVFILLEHEENWPSMVFGVYKTESLARKKMAERLARNEPGVRYSITTAPIQEE